MSRIRNRLSYANVMSTLAFFLALTGTAFAAATIGTAQLKNLAVTTPKLGNSSVTTGKIATNAVGASDIAANAVGTSEIAALGVAATDLGTDSVTNPKIAGNAVTTTEIAQGTILQADLAASTQAAMQTVKMTTLEPPALPYSTDTGNMMTKVIEAPVEQGADDLIWFHVIARGSHAGCGSDPAYTLKIDGVTWAASLPMSQAAIGFTGYASGQFMVPNVDLDRTLDFELWLQEDCTTLSLADFSVRVFTARG